jgi:hypothetical protein
VVIFEIAREGSVTEDFVTKNAEYRATEPVRRYVVLQQSQAAAAVFSRKGADWVTDLVAGEDAILAMPEIGVDVALGEIYAGLGFGDVAADD